MSFNIFFLKILGEDGKFLLHKVFPKNGLIYLTIRPSFLLIFWGSICLEMIEFSVTFLMYFIYLLQGKKKESEAGNLFSIHETVHLNSFPLFELNSRPKICEMVLQ